MNKIPNKNNVERDNQYSVKDFPMLMTPIKHQYSVTQIIQIQNRSKVQTYETQPEDPVKLQNLERLVKEEMHGEYISLPYKQ